jgi:hypothetical protein
MPAATSAAATAVSSIGVDDGRGLFMARFANCSIAATPSRAFSSQTSAYTAMMLDGKTDDQPITHGLAAILANSQRPKFLGTAQQFAEFLLREESIWGDCPFVHAVTS